MLAYMYSICRCSVMEDNDDAEHIKAYIWKMIKIYLIATMIISDDRKNIYKATNIKQVSCEDYRI